MSCDYPWYILVMALVVEHWLATTTKVAAGSLIQLTTNIFRGIFDAAMKLKSGEKKDAL